LPRSGLLPIALTMPEEPVREQELGQFDAVFRLTVVLISMRC